MACSKSPKRRKVKWNFQNGDEKCYDLIMDDLDAEIEYLYASAPGTDTDAEASSRPFFGRDVLSEDFMDMISTKSGDIGVNVHFPSFDSRYLVHRNSFYELIYLHRGSAQLETGGRFFDLHEGDAVLVNPGTLHGIRLLAQDSRLVNLLFRKRLFQRSFFDLTLRNSALSDFILQGLHGKGRTGGFLIFRDASRKSEALSQDIGALLREYRLSRTMREDALELRLCLLLLDLGEVLSFDKKNERKDAEDAAGISMTSLLAYLQDNIQSVTLGDAAAHFHYTPRYFSVLIHEVYGKSFSGLMQDLRVRQAQLYLRSTDLPVSEVMRRVGYENSAYFYKLFRERTGMTPAQCRQNAQQKEG